jgi:hypothetical protein
VDFSKPAASQFAFNAPPGTKVTESNLSKDLPGASSSAKPSTKPSAADEPKVVGKGWTAVVVGRIPTDTAASGTDKAGAGSQLGQLQGILKLLPKTSGSWGSGRVLTGTLFTAVVTDDGRFAVGAVTPARLYAALAAK